MILLMSATRETTLARSHPNGSAAKVPLRLGGVVIEGDRRGRELGYPTANVALPPGLEVPEAVFAGIVERADGSTYWSAISVGRRETFYGSDGVNLLEAFLLDFSGDLYGEYLSMSLLEVIREQARFDTVADLIAQISRDVESVRRLAELAGIAR
jgi:FAD synthase